MTNKMSRRLVVDASVARSAGTTENPNSILCRQFLEIMRQVRHKLIMTSEIEREWIKHRSTYATVWLAAMQRRNLVLRVGTKAELERVLLDLVDEAPDLLIDQPTDFSPKQQAAIRKDLLLILAACCADQIVASEDEKMRRLLGFLAPHCREIAQILWVNPVTDSDAHSWLKAGARNDPNKLLGASNNVASSAIRGRGRTQGRTP